MTAFRTLLIAMIVLLYSYTLMVGVEHGWNLLPIFFGDMVAMTWPGQFNLDFMGFLLLSGLWLAWRHHFSAGGLALGLFGIFGGIALLAPYLLWASIQARGDVKVVLLGAQRAQIQ